MLKKIIDNFKREIHSTKEHYQNLESSEFSSTPTGDEIEMTYQGITFKAPRPTTDEEYQRKRQANDA